MTSTRLRLVLLKQTSDTQRPDSDGPLLDSLKSAFDVLEVENVEEARRLLKEAAPGSMTVSPELAVALAAQPEPATLLPAFEHFGEGLGIVDSSGIVWQNARLASMPDETRHGFLEQCRDALEQFNRAPAGVPLHERVSRRFAFVCGDAHYELVVSAASSVAKDPQRVASVVGVLLDVTARWQLQQKLDAIDSAGSELMRMDSATIRKLDMAARLRLLEEKVVQNVHDLLEFDNFEIRLLDRESRRLELVVAKGITPLKIGEVIHAELEGNGISGYVASTGRSYMCSDAMRDPLYREGLDNAASSLTVPLLLHDEVIGVFNIESNTPNSFNDRDRQFAEIFGRYVAMAMNILDLLVVERYTTNEQVSANVLSELSTPIEAIEQTAEALGSDDMPK
ncbi:MAG: GAF domain-containing protein, partial [Planctomycetota bacterium]